MNSRRVEGGSSSQQQAPFMSWGRENAERVKEHQALPENTTVFKTSARCEILEMQQLLLGWPGETQGGKRGQERGIYGWRER